MFKKKLVAMLSALTILCASACAFVACGNNGGENQGNNGGNSGGGGNQGNTNQHKVTVTISVRDINFNPLSEQVYYDGEVICSSEAQPVTVTVPQADDLTQTAKINLGSESCVAYVSDYGAGGTQITIIKTDKPAEEFFNLSGKIVYAWDDEEAGIWSGETGAPGVELRIGESVLPIDSNGRDFGLKMVHKDSVITAYKEGFTFVDINGEEYNNICFAERLADENDRGLTYEETIVNGQKLGIKALGGVTFRLNNKIS